MKTTQSNVKQFLKVLLIITLVYSCSSDSDNEEDSDNDPQTGTNVNFTILSNVPGTPGTAMLNGVYDIIYPDNDDQVATSVFAGIYNEDTFEGTVKVVSLTFSHFVSDEDYYDITMKLPAGIGSYTLGEFETTSTGMISVEPTYNMILSFDSNRAFYNGNIGSNNEILTSLLSKNVNVTISEYEETVNSFGLTTVSHIKGSVGQSGNEFFFKAYTGPTSDPEELLCNVTVNFEYTIAE
jgi:hypothetical protein